MFLCVGLDLMAKELEEKHTGSSVGEALYLRHRSIADRAERAVEEPCPDGQIILHWSSFSICGEALKGNCDRTVNRRVHRLEDRHGDGVAGGSSDDEHKTRQQ